MPRQRGSCSKSLAALGGVDLAQSLNTSAPFGSLRPRKRRRRASDGTADADGRKDTARAGEGFCRQMQLIRQHRGTERGGHGPRRAIRLPNVASGVLGNPGTLEAMHFANWEPAWMDLYRRNKFLRIDPAHLGGELRRARRHRPIARRTAEGPSACSRRADGSALRRVYRPAAGCRQPVRGGRFCRPHGPEQRRGTLRSARACRRGVRSRRGAERPGAASQRAPAPPEFSARERECLLHLIDGRSTAFIAKAMDVTEVTVRFHSRNLRAKTGTINRAQLTALAIAQGSRPGDEDANAKRASAVSIFELEFAALPSRCDGIAFRYAFGRRGRDDGARHRLALPPFK